MVLAIRSVPSPALYGRPTPPRTPLPNGETHPEAAEAAIPASTAPPRPEASAPPNPSALVSPTQPPLPNETGPEDEYVLSPDDIDHLIRTFVRADDERRGVVVPEEEVGKYVEKRREWWTPLLNELFRNRDKLTEELDPGRNGYAEEGLEGEQGSGENEGDGKAPQEVTQEPVKLEKSHASPSVVEEIQGAEQQPLPMILDPPITGLKRAASTSLPSPTHAPKRPRPDSGRPHGSDIPIEDVRPALNSPARPEILGEGVPTYLPERSASASVEHSYPDAVSLAVPSQNKDASIEDPIRATAHVPRRAGSASDEVSDQMDIVPAAVKRTPKGPKGMLEDPVLMAAERVLAEFYNGQALTSARGLGLKGVDGQLMGSPSKSSDGPHRSASAEASRTGPPMLPLSREASSSSRPYRRSRSREASQNQYRRRSRSRSVDRDRHSARRLHSPSRTDHDHVHRVSGPERPFVPPRSPALHPDPYHPKARSRSPMRTHSPTRHAPSPSHRSRSPMRKGPSPHRSRSRSPELYTPLTRPRLPSTPRRGHSPPRAPSSSSRPAETRHPPPLWKRLDPTPMGTSYLAQEHDRDWTPSLPSPSLSLATPNTMADYLATASAPHATGAPPIELPTPSLWGALPGSSHSDVHTLTFYLASSSCESFHAWADRHWTPHLAPWSPGDIKSLTLRPVDTEELAKLQAAMAVVSPSLSKAQVAQALCALQTRWPPRGSVVVALNGRAWMPSEGCVDPESGPLELGEYLKEGWNELKIVQLGDVKDRFFLVVAQEPEEEEGGEDSAAVVQWDGEEDDEE